MTQPESSTITAIEPQARNRDRFNVFVDGEWVAGVHAEVVVASGLRVGQVISTDRLQALSLAEETRKARESAYRLLGYRARSHSELRQRLLQKGYEGGAVEEALAGLERSGLINDAEFSESWVRARTGSRPQGRTRIAADLRRKGVARDVIDEALKAVDPDREMDLALAVGRRKMENMRDEDPHSARRKLGSLLLRRGFGGDICVKVLDILLRSEDC